MERYHIKPQSGMRFILKKDQRITVIDDVGGRVADFFAEKQGTHEEYLSPSVTIDCNESLYVGVGTVLYTNLYRPMFRIIYDDVQVHDMLFPSCSRRMYDFFYQNGENHPNCLDNINKAMGTGRTMIQPVNLFMNTTVAANGKICIDKPRSKAGDKVTLLALEDCVIGISACSVVEADTNSGVCTPITVEIE